MLEYIKSHKKITAAVVGLVTLIGVAFTYPEHAETVARAFCVLIGIL